MPMSAIHSCKKKSLEFCYNYVYAEVFLYITTFFSDYFVFVLLSSS